MKRVTILFILFALGANASAWAQDPTGTATRNHKGRACVHLPLHEDRVSQPCDETFAEGVLMSKVQELTQQGFKVVFYRTRRILLENSGIAFDYEVNYNHPDDFKDFSRDERALIRKKLGLIK